MGSKVMHQPRRMWYSDYLNLLNAADQAAQVRTGSFHRHRPDLDLRPQRKLELHLRRPPRMHLECHALDYFAAGR